ncbi:TlpA disulfide reductase family protein [uncultured Aquimarina sp.]|uniref:TlpA family protein disulfide reductase n=1 Tax=uncultured Aquimarina sp. TaxID=575652 RepID=UPI002634F52E|nr:TlpA disulfide reductase family protein [uncultured Aquimarina sp.]
MKNFLTFILFLSFLGSYSQKQFPDFEVSDTDKKTSSLNSQLNKLTIIDLWATWCKPCIAETPFLEEIKKKYGSNIDVIYISLDFKKERWHQFISKKQSKKKHFWVPPNSPLVEFIGETKTSGDKTTTTWSIPKFFLVDKNGELLSDNCPLPSSGNLEKLLDKHL